MCQKALRSRFSGTPHHPPQKDSASQYCASGSPASANGVQIATAVAGSPCCAAARPSSKFWAKAGAHRNAASKRAMDGAVARRAGRSAIVELLNAVFHRGDRVLRGGHFRESERSGPPSQDYDRKVTGSHESINHSVQVGFRRNIECRQVFFYLVQLHSGLEAVREGDHAIYCFLCHTDEVA